MTPADVRAIVAPNPLPASVDWALVESTLNVKIVSGLPQRKVVGSAGVTQGEADLLGAERQEVDGLGESADRRVRVALEFDCAARGLLAVLDALKDEVASGREVHCPSPSSSGRTDEDGAAGAPDAPAAPVRGRSA